MAKISRMPDVGSALSADDAFPIYTPSDPTNANKRVTAARLAAFALGGISSGTPRQLLQTNASGTAAEWTSSVDISGTITGASINPTGTTVPVAGLFRPAANTLAWATNTLERMRVQSDGSVGIGTTSASALLDVRGNVHIGTADAASVALEIGQGATGDRAVFIDLTGDTTYTDFGLRISRSAGANANTEIRTRGTGTLTLTCAEAGNIALRTTDVERMRVNSDGRLLVGTTTVASGAGQGTGTIIQVNGSIYAYEGGNSSNSGGAVAFGVHALATFTPMAQIKGLLVNGTGTEQQGHLGFYTRPLGAAGQSLTERIRITEAGNVLIGNTTGTERLTVTGNAQANSFIPSSATIPSNGVYLPAANSVGIATNTLERMRVQSDGRVGIGTTSANSLLDVRGNMHIGAADANGVNIEIGQGATGDRAVIIDMTSDTTYTDFGLRIGRNAGANGNSEIRARGTGNLLLNCVEAGNITLRTTDVERMRVDGSGNVLIGNTTGTERLSVTGKVQLTATGDSYMVGTNNVVGSRKTGWAAATGTATRTTFVTSSVSTADLAQRVKALIDDLISHGLIGT
jgi:hypothetical protein